MDGRERKVRYNSLNISYMGQRYTYMNMLAEILQYSLYLGKIFSLENWQFCRKSPNLKSTSVISCTIALCRSARNCQI